MRFELFHGDCLEVLKGFEDSQFDSIVTDPPYGLKFMGKHWDYSVPSVEVWKECLRVLKPGGHLLAFGGTRTYHRLVVNIEDAGFEIRDQIMWIYGSGFPKSLNIGLAIDKEAGAPNRGKAVLNIKGAMTERDDRDYEQKGVPYDAKSDDAKRWSGWGTALKPANEPICLARKPLSEKTVAKNVLKHGVGGLNVDASRIEGLKPQTVQGGRSIKGGAFNGNEHAENRRVLSDNSQGRFPANILFDEAAAAVLDEQTGELKAGVAVKRNGGGKNIFSETLKPAAPDIGYGGEGGASRFFYVAKASKKDRGEGNIHPTVKPIKLMEYLVKLVTPEGGIVLDPFMGSGTTGLAALSLGLKFAGIEFDKKYLSIARRRIKG